MSERKAKAAAADYEVGYGKPPVGTRFQKGRSGNPRGRPRATAAAADATLRDLFKAEARRIVSIQDGAGASKMTVAQAVVRSVAEAAMQGDMRAQQMFTRMVGTIEEEERLLVLNNLEEAIKYKAHWEDQIWKCKRDGQPIPQPQPHPDQIIVDVHAGTFRIVGPITPEEKKEWDKLRVYKPKLQAEIADLKSLLESARGSFRRNLEERIAEKQEYFDMLTRMFEEWP